MFWLCFLTLNVPYILTDKPNIVLLYIENINEVKNILQLIESGELSKNALPNIYKLKNESIMFHNMYTEISSSSNIAALLTGKPAVDLGIIRGKLLPFTSFPSLASTGGLELGENTLPEVLQTCGYRTWYTGYWKLGLGDKGDRFPMKHGFDTWMGTAHPHSDWCHRKESNKSISHPYTNLLYKTSCLWTVILLLLTTLVWFKFISWKLYLNLLIYTFCTSLAFYISLHLFMIQRSASCVLYYHDMIYQQPYEMKNLTLHFTQHSRKLIDVVAGVSPFFMVLNYMKMGLPSFHSNYFRTKSTDTWHSTLLELDWSVGEIVSKLKETQSYDDTFIILTGSNHCEPPDVSQNTINVYERYKENNYRAKEVSEEKLWDHCLKTVFFIKDIKDGSENTSTSIYDIVSTTDLFETVLDMASCQPQEKDSTSLLQLYKVHPAQSDVSLLFDQIIRTLKQDVTSINTHNASYDESPMKLIVESSDEEATVEALEIEEILNDTDTESSQIKFTKARTLFHYFNIEKPIMITFKERFQLIYAYMDSSGYLVKLKSPWLLDLEKNNEHISSQEIEQIYKNITENLKSHLAERQNKNPWSSQFELPVYPWLLPCANFPHCETAASDDDFSDLVTSISDS